MPMPAKYITRLFTACLVLSSYCLFAQTKRTKIAVDRQMKDTFSFTNLWAYYWMVMKDDNGRFTKTDGEPLTASDTAHLYYTANCVTNIQGGYSIRYCEAQKNKNGIRLVFTDGLPAYGSEFYCYLHRDSFYFKPSVSYPMFIPGERIEYAVTKQKLTIQKLVYALGDTLVGYINVEFVETASAPGHKAQKTKLYLKGYIKTPVTGATQQR